MIDSIGLLGYASSSLAYIVFALLLFAARNKTMQARWVLVCAIVTVVANVVAAMQIRLGYSLQWALVIDSIKIACWSVWILLCNTKLSSFKALVHNYYIKQYLLVWCVLMVSCWAVSYLLNSSYQYVFLLFVSLNLWSLVLLEQLYRSANSQVRWAIWPLVIAIASISIFDFVLYAQAMMVGRINFDFWYSRGFIALIVIPLLLVSIRRIKNGTVRIFVSRNVVFYSSMLMMAGIYLLVMAFAGYIINFLGGEWGGVVSVSFLMLGSIVLVALLITETLRRRVKVFIAKNFFANKYEYRDEWLNLIGKIETTSADNYYQMATQIMMSKVGAKYGAIVKQITSTQFDVKYTNGLEFEDIFIPQLIHLSHFCKREGWIVDLKEYEQAPSIYPDLSLNLVQCQEKNITIVVPIFIGKAFYGLFIFASENALEKLNWEDRDLLFAVSKQLGNFVSLSEANDRLAESRQFDAFNRMSAFLVHDLKNVQAQLSLITANAEKHRANPAFVDDVFETVDSATQRLDKVLSQLRNKQIAQSKNQRVELSQLIQKVVAQCNVRQPLVDFSFHDTCSINIDGEMCQSVLNHLIQNAQEATNKNGWVKVALQRNTSTIEITIADNGCGMSKEFVEKRLFKPFDTTKGNAGMGIGVYEAKQFIENMAGTIRVASLEGQGTTFTLHLPIDQTAIVN